MTAFLDIPLPENILGMPVRSMPRTSTQIVVAKSGDEGRNRNWQNPLRRFQLPEAVCDQTDFEEALDHWLVMGGPFNSFPFRDPFEFASVALDEVNVVPEISGDDQVLVSAADTNGLTYRWQITKTRTIGGQSYVRPIFLPILDSCLFLMSCAIPAPWNGNGTLTPTAPGSVPSAFGGPFTIDVSRPGGIATVSPAPHATIAITCGFLFDTEVRWEADDSFDAIGQSLYTSGAAAINLVEVRRC